MTQGMSIYKTGAETWQISTREDTILIVLQDGTLRFYRPAEDVADIS